ncbi:MAG: DegT/DnrJ/EryC1/StrS family aminotransferase [Thermodesulfobacteriota bacterium]
MQLLDLASQYGKIKNEVMKEVKAVCDSQHYVLGKNVAAIEQEIAQYCGARYAVGVASGTDALILALKAAGVEAGDRVITTSFTFFASAGSIAMAGAEPVFVDIDPRTFNIDPARLEAELKRSSKGVKAVMPIHLYGQCADMDPINRIARRYGLKVIEDAAQSIGAAYRGRMAGSLGDFGCFSFYPTKNLGCFGDGGMVTTGSARSAQRLRMLRGHGSRKRYYHEFVGTNSRLDEIQAAILRVKLKYLEQWTEARISNGRRYDELFAKASIGEVTVPHVEGWNRMVYNQYVIGARKRDTLRAHLAGLGIGSEIYYPHCLHQQKCFKHLGYKKGSLPVSEKAAKEVLALPIYPELKAAQQRYVVESIAGFYSHGGKRR